MVKHRVAGSIVVVFVVAFLFVSCGSSNIVTIRAISTPVVSATTQSVPVNTLRSLAQARHFFVGSTVNVFALQQEPTYAATLAREFNMVTPETSMKFDATEPQPGVFTFEQGDSIVSFAREHGMQARGHTLVWYNALPGWLINGKFTRDQLIAILRDHIMTEVAHYRGQVNIWDVVNEAVAEVGTLRDTIWLRGIGPDYLDMAFRWAHEASPQARLFYNDYGGEGLGPKSDAIYALVKGMLQRGVPINGVGLQMHVSIDSYPKKADVLANMRRLEALGLEVQITEMDVKIQDDSRPMLVRLQLQAQVYANMLSACLSEKRCTAFVMWGFTDRHSWIPAFTGHADAPLIFDLGYRPKPAYLALMQAFHA